MRALIVDDDDIVLSSCRMVLEAEGMEVTLAPTVELALEALERGSFDFLLIDVKMPVHDGYFLLERMAASFPAVPVVVMSGFSTDETVARGYALGAARFLAKPFIPDELVEVVRSLFSKEVNDGRHESPGD